MFIPLGSVAVKVEDLYPVESDRTIVEDVMDSIQPGWAFTVGGQAVKVHWTNGAGVPAVKVGGVSKSYYWYDDGITNGYRCDDVTWMKLHFDLGKALVPVVLVMLDESVGAPGDGYAFGAGDTRSSYQEMTTVGGMTIEIPGAFFARCCCVGPSPGYCDDSQCRRQINCGHGGDGTCKYGGVCQSA